MANMKYQMSNVNKVKPFVGAFPRSFSWSFFSLHSCKKKVNLFVCQLPGEGDVEAGESLRQTDKKCKAGES